MRQHDFTMSMVHSDGVSYRCRRCEFLSFHVNGCVWDERDYIPGAEFVDQAYTDDCDKAIITKVQSA